MAHIAIIGTGRMAAGLGSGWLQAGHHVVFGSRSPGSKQTSSGEVGQATVTTHAAALQDAEIVVLALPFPTVEGFSRQHADQLRGKVVIDISNPFQHLPDNQVAGAELTAAAIGSDAHVIAAFKDTFARTLRESTDPKGTVRDVHFAGDSEWAKVLVARLITDLGFQPVDCGALRNARVLDGMVALMIELDQRYAGGEARASWKLLT